MDFDTLADPSSIDEEKCHPLSDPAKCAVLVSAEQVRKSEAEVAAAEAKRLVWKLEQSLGWIAYRSDQNFRSLSRIELGPPTFFGQSYKSISEPSPLKTLTAALLSGQIEALVNGVEMTRAECISLLSERDGLWTKELVFLPDDVRGFWRPKTESGPSSTKGVENSALATLKGFLQRQQVRETT